MALTFKHLKARVSQVTGDYITDETDPDRGEVVNEAGRHLFNVHSWSWRMRPPTTLDFSEDTEYVALPADFDELVGYAAGSSANLSVQPASIQDIVRLREAGTAAAAFCYRFALVFAATDARTVTPANVETGDVFTLTVTGDDGSTGTVQFTATAATVANVTAGLAAAWNASSTAIVQRATATDDSTHVTLTSDIGGVPFTVTSATTDGGGNDTQTLTVSAVTGLIGTPRLELAPTPASDTDDAMTIVYRAKWVELSSDAAVPNIPLDYERILTKYVRAFSLDYQDNTFSDRYFPHVETVDNSPELFRLMQSDGRTQGVYGILTGGAVERHYGAIRDIFSDIADPS